MSSYFNYQLQAKLAIKLLRPHHWIKNLVVFIPAFFAARILDQEVLISNIIAFLSFSLVASAVYIFNDIGDKEDDKLHPEKSKRPIASGAITQPTAIAIALVLLVAGTALGVMLNAQFLGLIAAYFCMNLLYTFALKHMVIVDITVIAIGFLLRIWAGGIINDIPISYWLLLMIFLLSLFMGFAKRRDDALLLRDKQIKARKNIVHYDIPFINVSMSVMAAVIIVCYIMYSVSPEIRERTGSQHVYITSFFVILGMLQYLYRTIGQQKEGAPVKVLLTDRFIQFLMLSWLVVFYFILYHK